MDIETIKYLIMLGALIIASIVGIVYAIVRGDVKKDIIVFMDEAEEKYKDVPKPEKSVKKLEYVVDKIKAKYKLVRLFLNVQKFIEYIVSLSKINKK